ncbi:MAG: MFS transporter [Thermomicrobiales bacterium]
MKSTAADNGRRSIEINVMAALCTAAVVGILNSAQLGPFIPDIADDLHRSVPVIGQAAAVFLVVAAVSGLVVGPLADHYGHRRTLLLGLVLSAISAAGGGLAPNYGALLATRVVGGLGMAATIGVVFAMVSTRYAGENRLKALSIISGSIALTGIIGIPVLTGISALLTWRAAWEFVAVLGAAAIALLLAFCPADPDHPAERITPREIISSYIPLLRSREMLALFGGSAAQGLLFMAALTYQGAYFIDEMGLSVQRFGLIAAVGGTAFAAGSFVAGKLGRFDLRVLFSLSMALSGAILAPAFSDQTGAVTATMFIAAGFLLAGVSVVTILGLLATSTPSGQATTLVINESVFSIGAAGGAAVGGLAIGLGGYESLSFILPVFGITGGLLVWRPRRFGAAIARPE